MAWTGNALRCLSSSFIYLGCSSMAWMKDFVLFGLLVPSARSQAFGHCLEN